jgi:hypothetical protein
MILYRCFAWNRRARPGTMGSPLWFPREFQGEGRHDNPDAYGCLYLADRAVSCVVEQLARFRGQRLTQSMLVRADLPLALAELELAENVELLDLDEPAVLRRERLRPSQVATRQRELTQPQARVLHDKHPSVAGLRWWSTYESLWANVTVFDRAALMLRARNVRALTLDDPAVSEGAEFFGMRVG